MNTSTNINLLLVLVSICIIARAAHSMSTAGRNAMDEIEGESQMLHEVESNENLYPERIHPWSGKRRIDSAEKYFDWAGKTNRPMEYLRGKRFWLFAKKEEHGGHPEAVQEANMASNAVKQGIWRSGIVGRRRR